MSTLAALESAADAECTRIRQVVESVRKAEADFKKEQESIRNPTPLNLSGRICLDVGGEK